MAMPGQYQQYPQDPQNSYVPAARRVPPSVQRAVLLMRVGAGIKGLEVLLFLSLNHYGLTGATVAGAVIGIGLWLWMAASNQHGNHWARVTGTVFFGLATLGFLVDIIAVNTVQNNDNLYQIQVPSGIYAIIACDVLNWVVGLLAVILIWQKVSSAFYNPPPAYGAGWGVPGAPAVYPSTYPQGGYPQAGYPQAPGYPAPYQQGGPVPPQGPTQLYPYQQNPYPQAPGQDVPPTDPWATSN